MLKNRSFWLVFAILGICAPALADVTDFTVTPSSPVMGEIVTYEAVNNGTKPVQSFKWEYQFTSGTCPPTWVLAAFVSPTAVFFESRPGTWQMRLTANYQGSYGYPPPPPPPPAVITKNVTIAPADSFQIISGLSTPTPRYGDLIMKFRVRAGMRDCGPNLMGILAQERITNHAFPVWPDLGCLDANWWPDSPQPTFQLMGNTIEDTKRCGVPDNRWNGLSNGDTYHSRDQSLRLKYVDPCGTTKYINLGTVRLHSRKVDANNWEVYTTP